MSRNEKKQYTIPTDSATALSYLDEQGVGNSMLVKYGQILEKPKYLRVFLVKKFFVDRIEFLTTMLQKRKEKRREKKMARRNQFVD